MKILMRTSIIAAVVAVACGGFVLPAAAQTPEQVAKMEAAAPAEAPAKPAKPRKVLVFNLCTGYAHSAIPYGAKALEIIGKKTGAFETVNSTDIAVFEPESLSQFDAVVMNNTTGELFLPKDVDKLPADKQAAARQRDAALKKSLLDFIRGGKGIVGIHAATDCFYKWEEYGKLMGGYFDGHPWNEDVGVKLDDPIHPVLAPFQGQNFHVADEIYQLRAPYSRENLRVLMSLNTAETNMNKGDAVHRKDGDFGVSWVRSYGQGRVFYCSLGHREEIFWNPKILGHYLAGLQFALGDLPADTTPSASLSADYLGESKAKGLDLTIAALTSYEVGQDYAALNAIDAAVRESFGDEAARARLAKKLGALLEGDATLACKDFVCRQLYLLGVEESVDVVAPLLSEVETVNMALYALQRMDYPSVDETLLAALDNAPDDAAKAGIINALGARGTALAVDALTELAAGSASEVTEAALCSLGKIGGTKAAALLASLFESEDTPEALANTVAEAYLACANRFAAQGEDGLALGIFEAVYEGEVPRRFRTAAFVGLVGARGDDAALQLVEVLVGDDADMQAIAAGLAKDVPGATATSVLADKLPDMPAPAQALLIRSLAHRGDAGALSAVTDAVASEDEAVRVAALNALAKLGDGAVVPLLADTAAATEGAEQSAARNSLDQLSGMEINAAMLEYFEKAEPEAQAELARSFAARQAHVAVPALLKTAASEEEAVRTASFEALGTLAAAEDLDALVGLLLDTEENTRDAAEAAVLSVCLGIEDTTQRAEPLLAFFPKTQGKPETRAALLRLLGQTGDDNALDALRSAMKARHEEVQNAAIRALAEWPNAKPLDDMFELASKSDNPTHRVLALRGYVRMIELADAMTLDEILGCYKKACELAQGADEKRAVLTGLGKIGHPSALELIKPYLSDPEVKEDAKLAATQVKNSGYKASASHNGGNATKAFDGRMDTRWDTASMQTPGQWFAVDLGWKQLVEKIVLDTTGSDNDFPAAYEVYLSNDGKEWGKAVATGKGDGPVTEIALEPASARYVRIVQTGSKSTKYWSIHEMKIESK